MGLKHESYVPFPLALPIGLVRPGVAALGPVGKLVFSNSIYFDRYKCEVVDCTV